MAAGTAAAAEAFAVQIVIVPAGNQEVAVEAQELYRGRLIDHLQLVVRDLAASRRFYEAVLRVLQIPIGGSADDYFWADEFRLDRGQQSCAGKADRSSPSGVPGEGPRCG